MQTFLTLTRRELAAYFLSLTGYVIIAAVTFLVGLIFTVVIDLYADTSFEMPVTELFFNTLWFWLLLPLVAPVITMRLFALEKSTGTYETLMTTPVGDLEVVAAKFIAAMVFYAVMWLPLLAGLFVIRRYTSESASMDSGTIWGMYLGLILIGCLFISIGCFTSAITRSQVMAAMISLVFGISLLLLGFMANQIQVHDWRSEAISLFNLAGHVRDFLRGVLDTRLVIFYLSLTLFFLFLTLRAVESRRWR
jgi:ABC-2 type transport system permease protein